VENSASPQLIVLSNVPTIVNLSEPKPTLLSLGESRYSSFEIEAGYFIQRAAHSDSIGPVPARRFQLLRRTRGMGESGDPLILLGGTSWAGIISASFIESRIRR
jgi:hypothetical protein